MKKLFEAKVGDAFFGFKLLKKERVESASADLYTMKHEKTGADLLYFDRPDENKTFSICFETLPEDSTGVFHILEHSVLNGSKKYPVKEPFVSMLQSSMQTFLNAMTFGDKTLYPVSSRNFQDFFNLMSVYLDAVFCPKIYEKPEIFMQEGWHYEYESPDGKPYFNGVVYSEMKGVFSEVDAIIEEETNRLLYPDNCYGYVSGGHPENIPDLTYEQFISTHKRFYHPSNSKIILDGNMDIEKVLEYIDGEYLSKYEYRANDFDFVRQEPRALEKTVCYEAKAGEEKLAHMTAAKILCDYSDVEKIYAAKILADYLAGTNASPLKRAFLEKGIAQDVNVYVGDGIFQPSVSFVVRNTGKERFEEIKALLSSTVKSLCEAGLNKKALSASLESFSFSNKEISEPYGVILAIKVLESWLYGGDPLVHIDNTKIFDSLREKLNGDYFEKLLLEMFGDESDKSYLYVLPSMTKGADDAALEQKKLDSFIADWDDEKKKASYDAFAAMSAWQKTPDGEDVLSTLPHLRLCDVPLDVKRTETVLKSIAERKVLEVKTGTNGIVYLNLIFDISDFSLDELRTFSTITGCFGELSTKNYSADELQTEIKSKLGGISARIEYISKKGDLENCSVYAVVKASMLEENAGAALPLVLEILQSTRFDEADKINEIFVQNEYFLKQSLIGGGHSYAMTKALSAFSKEGALKEAVDGESFVGWFSEFVGGYTANADDYAKSFAEITRKAFSRGRLFAAYSGELSDENIEKTILALEDGEIKGGAAEVSFDKNDTPIEIPASVGFSAMGNNIYALGGEFSGSCSVLSSLMTFSYLWNMVRVQGGAYGTGMGIRANGDMFTYSYGDHALENTKRAYLGMADFLDAFLAGGVPLDDIIIGTVNTTEPLVPPSAVCSLEASRFLRGTTFEDVAKLRREILTTSVDDLKKLSAYLRRFAEEGKFCAVGDKASVEFVSKA